MEEAETSKTLILLSHLCIEPGHGSFPLLFSVCINIHHWFRLFNLMQHLNWITHQLLKYDLCQWVGAKIFVKKFFFFHNTNQCAIQQIYLSPYTDDQCIQQVQSRNCYKVIEISCLNNNYTIINNIIRFNLCRNTVTCTATVYSHIDRLVLNTLEPSLGQKPSPAFIYL